MVSTSTKELLAQRLRSQLDSLPDDDPRRRLIEKILDGQPDAPDARQEMLRRIAGERYVALPDGDPLKEVLGRMLGETQQTPPNTSPIGADVTHAFRPDVWEAVHAMQRSQQSLFSAVKTIDARAAAAMQEAQRIAVKAVELQEYLNMVLEEVHQNTEMLRSFKETFTKEE